MTHEEMLDKIEGRNTSDALDVLEELERESRTRELWFRENELMNKAKEILGMFGPLPNNVISLEAYKAKRAA